MKVERWWRDALRKPNRERFHDSRSDSRPRLSRRLAEAETGSAELRSVAQTRAYGLRDYCKGETHVPTSAPARVPAREFPRRTLPPSREFPAPSSLRK